MKINTPENQKLSVRAGIIALACFAFTSFAVAATAPGLPSPGEAVRQTSRAIAAPKTLLLAQSDAEQKLIDQCRKNFGTDCERKAREAMMPPAERRQAMIDRCRNNLGTNCEKSVDTELAAEQNEQKFIRPKPAQ